MHFESLETGMTLRAQKKNGREGASRTHPIGGGEKLANPRVLDVGDPHSLLLIVAWEI